ncbi:MAG: tetratricopeptide repeat protein [Elainellaceae cyanobacterium]
MAAGIFLFRQVLKTRRVESTLSRLENKLTKEKGAAKDYYELGSIYLDKRLYAQSVTLFKKALKAKDLDDLENKALVQNALGFAYAAQEQYDLAIGQYKKALDGLPEYPTALNNLGFVYEKKQLTAQALEAYEQALALDPKNTTAKRRAESLRKRLVLSS